MLRSASQSSKGLPGLFSDRDEKDQKAEDALKARLYQEIGQLKVELFDSAQSFQLDWLNKKSGWTTEAKRMLIEADHPRISISRQCELLGLPHSSLYYARRGEDAYSEHLMRRIDEQYTRTPFYGVRRMTAWLRRQGEGVNPKRVRRLIRMMGLEAIYPKRRLSLSNKENRRYPYLLKGVTLVLRSVATTQSSN